MLRRPCEPPGIPVSFFSSSRLVPPVLHFPSPPRGRRCVLPRSFAVRSLLFRRLTDFICFSFCSPLNFPVTADILPNFPGLGPCILFHLRLAAQLFIRSVPVFSPSPRPCKIFSVTSLFFFSRDLMENFSCVLTDHPDDNPLLRLSPQQYGPSRFQKSNEKNPFFNSIIPPPFSLSSNKYPVSS